MHKLGLKLWSTNNNYVDEAKRLYDSGIYEYLELYSVPGSYNNFINIWSALNIPYIIHAPHAYGGLNLAKRENLGSNSVLIKETLQYADKLKASKIIFHPGINGNIEETVYQLNLINDNRIILENKPFWGIHDEKCNGNSPEEIKHIIDNTRVGFCLDIGHAIYSANARNVDPYLFLSQYISLKPEVYHVMDGNFTSLKDVHYNLGKGDFNLSKILNLLPDNSTITLETSKNYQDSLKDFVEDINYIKKLLRYPI